MASGKWWHQPATPNTTTVARLELTELLAHVDRLGLRSGFDFQDVETHGLGERTALTDGHDVTFLDTERWRHVGGDVLVTLLETLVLLHKVQVITTHDDRALHLGRQNDTLEDTTTDRDVAGEWTLLVDVLPFNGRLWRLEAKTDFLVETWTGLLARELLRREEDAILLLERLFVL